MGIRNLGKRLAASPAELDDERLQHRFADLGLTKIADAPARRPVKVGGEIQRVLITPRNGVPALEIVVGDGTGRCTAIFSGRRAIGGLTHGRAVVLEGVTQDDGGRRVLLNPAYTLLAH